MQIYDLDCGCCCEPTLLSRKEKIRMLNEYREDLKSELNSVSEEIKELEEKKMAVKTA